MVLFDYLAFVNQNAIRNGGVMTTQETSETAETYRGVVLPRNPPIHNVIAKVLLERHQGGDTLPVVAWWGRVDCPEAQLDSWEDQDIFPIGIGPDKHDLRGLGSAAEVLAEDFNLALSPGEEAIIEMANKNQRTGHLTRHHMSMARTMRQLYELPAFDNHEVVERIGDAVHAFIRVQDGECAEGRTRANFVKQELFQSFLTQTKKGQFAPFTPAPYARDLWILGDSPEYILAAAEWWVEAHNAVRGGIEAARQKLASLDMMGELVFFEFPVENRRQTYMERAKGLYLETDIPFMSFAAWGARKEHNIVALITHDPETGHQALKVVDDLNIGHLAAAVGKAEPGLWHYIAEAGSLFNGGAINIDTPATQLNLRELLAAHKPTR